LKSSKIHPILYSYYTRITYLLSNSSQCLSIWWY